MVIKKHGDAYYMTYNQLIDNIYPLVYSPLEGLHFLHFIKVYTYVSI